MNRKLTWIVVVALIVVAGLLLLARRQPFWRSSSASVSIAPSPALLPAPFPASTETHARNVILFIGDGMGPEQVSAAQLALHGAGGRLEFQRFPAIATVTTRSADSRVTDSAAAATAIACGVRTNNRMIGVAPDGSPLKTILEAARDHGLATGLVTTTEITDATPAAFAAHEMSRRNRVEIAKDLLDSRVDVLLGCGPRHFIPKARGGERADGVDLIERAERDGYRILRQMRDLESPRAPKILGLFDASSRPGLEVLTATALDTLSRSPDGFFVMIENGESDSAGHNGDASRLLRGVSELERAVKVATEFASLHGDTLIVVMADHETGGLVIKPDSDPGRMRLEFTGDDHTAKPVPLFAWGPGAGSFSGEIENTAIAAILVSALQLGPEALTESQRLQGLLPAEKDN